MQRKHGLLLSTAFGCAILAATAVVPTASAQEATRNPEASAQAVEGRDDDLSAAYGRMAAREGARAVSALAVARDADTAAESSAPPPEGQGDDMSSLYSDMAAKEYALDNPNLPPQPPDWFALNNEFFFPGDADRADKIFGIDISYHQPTVDLSVLAAQNIKFVIMRATFGSRVKDTAFVERWKKAATLQGKTAFMRGTYHFLTPWVSGKEQCKLYLDQIDLAGGLKAGDLRPALDLEPYEYDAEGGQRALLDGNGQVRRDAEGKVQHYDYWQDFDAAAAIKIIDDCAAYIRGRTGVQPVVYTNRTFLTSLKGGKAAIEHLAGAHDLWLATLGNGLQSEKPNGIAGWPHTLWQFTKYGRVSYGFGGQLDVNIFNGSVETLRDQLAIPAKK